MRRLGRILVTILAVVGLLTLSTIALIIWGAARLEEKFEPALPSRMVLKLDLEKPFEETPTGDPLARLSGEDSYVLRQVVEALDRAAKDERVVGLLATAGDSHLGLARVQELRDAVARFGASGKPAVLFAETIGEGGSGTGTYYLATAFPQIWLQPSGEVGLTGFSAESPFFKGTMEMLGIQPEFGARHEFKSAVEMFTAAGLSDPARRNLDALLSSWRDQVAEGIASGRRMPAEKVRALFGKGPFLAREALSSGLVDHLGYRDQALQAANGGDDKVDEVDLADYAAKLSKVRGTKVALVVGSGAIRRGESDKPFSAHTDGFGAATIAQAFRDAIEDSSIKAILFRVDSPGGSYVGSDTVWNEVRRARAAGKPVVVSMGDVAASGGYFVAMGADRIVAQPGTITGSIGVFSGKVVMHDFWQKLGVTWDQVAKGDNAGMWSLNRPFTPEEWTRVNAMLDHVYADFTGKASQGRGISLEKMDELARGRVWSGADAKAVGLVDALGGWHEAMAQVRQVAGLAPDEPIEWKVLPKPKTALQKLSAALSSGGVERDPAVRALLRAATTLAPLAEAVAPRAGVLSLPPLEVRQ